MNRGINPGAIGVRVGVLVDAWQEASLAADFGRFMNAVRVLEVLASPYLRRKEAPQFAKRLAELEWPEPTPRGRDRAFEVGHQRVEEVLCCLNFHGIYGFRQVPYGDTDDLDDDLDLPDDDSGDEPGAPVGGGVDAAVLEGEEIEVEA